MQNFTRGLDPKIVMGTGHLKEISQIIKGVLEMGGQFYDNPNEHYEMSCPFCFCSGVSKSGDNEKKSVNGRLTT